MDYVPRHIAQLAGTIAAQADAIEANTISGPLSGAVARLVENVDTLRLWAEKATS